MGKEEKELREPLFAEERKNKILELLKENSKLLVPNLCAYFNVSPATIRNDLRELESTGLLKRTHGGAISNTKAKFELDSSQKEVENLPEKIAIARAAADLVEDGDTIAIDTGTTTFELAKFLTGKKNITIVLNDIPIAGYLEENTDTNIFLAGGSVRRKFHCTLGPMAVKALSNLSVDKAFMATNGVTSKKGITTPDIDQAEVKKAMIDIAAEVIVLCDSSKIGINGFAQVVPLSKVDRLITDDGICESEAAEIEAQGVRVDIVKV